MRLAQGHTKDCKQALDAGAGGIIIPMVESAEQLQMVRNACCWPPAGIRGLIGPYDLSASLGLTAQFQHPDFVTAMQHVRDLCVQTNMPCGVHAVAPDTKELQHRIDEGYRFIAYSIDSVFLNHAVLIPEKYLL